MNVRKTNLVLSEQEPVCQWARCHFCEKVIEVTQGTPRCLLSPQPTCPFCFSNNFYHKDCKRHILIMSYRGIIAHYYYQRYMWPNHSNDLRYYSEIKRMVDWHMYVGCSFPSFRYDPDTFLWFLDFRQIGKGKNQVGFEAVVAKTHEMLECFQITDWIDSHRQQSMKTKYDLALKEYYIKRKRPAKRRILVPTIGGTFKASDNEANRDRSFTADMFCISY